MTRSPRWLARPMLKKKGKKHCPLEAAQLPRGLIKGYISNDEPAERWKIAALVVIGS